MSERVRKTVIGEEGSPQPKSGAGIPLTGIEYRAVVSGLNARVRVIQNYANNLTGSVEAVYVFPLPDEASVIDCKMQIGDRKIKAEIKEREAARREYEDARDAGHHATLLEQERPNIFTMNVGGIEPGEALKVEVDYVQRIPWQLGGGRFRIPLVVAPRFILGNPTGKSAGGWAEDTDEVPDASRITPIVAKEGVSYKAMIRVSFSPGFKCRVNSPSHGVVVPDQTVAEEKIVEITAEVQTDRDFTVVYESTSKASEVAVHGGSFQNEEFRLISILPPGEYAESPSDNVFLMDVSGSMSGPKIAGLRTLAKKTLARLKERHPSNRACLIAFNTRFQVIHPMGEITDQMIPSLSSLEASGGTSLGPALTAAFQSFTSDSREKNILLISDGQTEDLRFNGQGARIIAVGIDSAVNDSTLKSLTQKTGGTSLWFYPGEDFERAANTLAGTLSGPVLRNLTLTGIKGDTIGVQDVFRGMPVTIIVRCGEESGKLPSEVTLSGSNPKGQREEWKVAINKPLECDFAGQLFAREFFREHPERDLQLPVSLKYGVICSYTSFVAVSLKEVPGQKPQRVEIPVNLPHGWDYDSVFGSQSVASVFALSVSGSRPMKRGLIATLNAGESRIMRSGKSRRPVIEEFFTSRSGDPDDELGLLYPPVSSGHNVQVPKHTCESGPRFNLLAKSLVDRVIGILVAVSQGKFEEAKISFKEISKRIAKEFDGLNETDQARLKYFLLLLASYGLKGLNLNGKQPTKDETLAWVNLFQKEAGQSFERKAIQPDWDGSAYLEWKFGGPRPSEEPWSPVP